MTNEIPAKARRIYAEERALALTGVYTAPPIPVHEIAEENGVQVVEADFGANESEVSGFCDFAGRKLYINAADSLSRKRFTIAHELGHWLLHKEISESNPEAYSYLPRFEKPDMSNVLEQEANHFAANLLVPKKLLLPVINAPVSALASVFDVSKTMMEIRLKNVKT